MPFAHHDPSSPAPFHWAGGPGIIWDMDADYLGHNPRCKRYCWVCGRRFYSVRRDRRDCSERCRKRRVRAAKAGTPIQPHAKYVEG